MIKHGIVIVLVASTLSCDSASSNHGVPDEVTCSECLVSAHVISTVGALDGPGMLEREPLAMSRDAKGRYVLYAGGGLPMIFGRDGAHVSDLGRPGDGPGELRGGLPIPVGGDSILVLASRATLFGPDFSYVRQIAVPAAFRGQWCCDGRIQ